MPHRHPTRLLMAGALLALTCLTAACESDVERQMRLEREALKKSGELEELQQQLDTSNPDPYKPDNGVPVNPGKFHRR